MYKNSGVASSLKFFTTLSDNTGRSFLIFLIVILFIHAFVAGTALKVGDGGKFIHSLHHFVLMAWIISLTVYGTGVVVSHLLL